MNQINKKNVNIFKPIHNNNVFNLLTLVGI